LFHGNRQQVKHPQQGQKALFSKNQPAWLHFAILRVDFQWSVTSFCGKNPKNKSYRMPFNVKKCKLFHFSFPKFKHSDTSRGVVIKEFAWNNPSKTPFSVKCLQVFN
jgi:hypothetical protein